MIFTHAFLIIFALVIMGAFLFSLTSIYIDNKKTPRRLSISRYLMFVEYKEQYYTTMLMSFVVPVLVKEISLGDLNIAGTVLYKALVISMTLFYSFDLYIIYRGYLWSKPK